MTSLEKYLHAMSEKRAVAVNETSYYDALSNLFNEVGGALKPKVKYVITPKGSGAGLPDGGLYTAHQLRRGAEASLASTRPERGCVEAKGLREEVGKIAASAQVEKYLKAYGQVLVTNYRDFLLVGRDEAGHRKELERYTLAAGEREFWELCAHPAKAGKVEGERFAEYLKRVMLHAAPLASPEDVARFLASYARDARARVEQRPDLPALQGLRDALEQALGLKFVGERGEHFFRSTLVQTLFYGIFSAWVLWAQEGAKAGGRLAAFNWKEAHWYLRVPMISALFNQLLDRNKLIDLGLVEVLDWTGATLNRIEHPTEFIRKFTEGHAVQYFYEPFLQEFDPDLRKQLGVWYTPQEIVKYMVARVDTVLREELGVAAGLAGEEVYVLDPCCGTGTYLVEVLRRIKETIDEQGLSALAGDRLRKAATKRVFGFEILPAPFVVAHLQLGLLLQTMDAALDEGTDERLGVFLTNALTGWEPPKGAKARLLFPEMEEERDRADEVKQKRPILVVIGNPPYNAFAGTSPEEEQGLVEPYKEGLIKKWGIKKFNLDDLYVRFFRLAERRITEETGRGVVCYISNYSYLSDPSFVVMRERFLSEFDAMWFDSLNGDSRETGKLTPEGEPDPSVFSTPYNKEGIRVGTAVGTLVRRNERRDKRCAVNYREFWGTSKREDLLASLSAKGTEHPYQQVTIDKELCRLSFRPVEVAAQYQEWPRLTELGEQDLLQGMDEDRANALINSSSEVLSNRIEKYFSPTVEWPQFTSLGTGLSRASAGFNPEGVRDSARRAEVFDPTQIRRYLFRPSDVRWCYYTSVPNVWKRSRPELWQQAIQANSFLLSRAAGVARPEGVPLLFATSLIARDCMKGHAVAFPVRLYSQQVESQPAQNHFFPSVDSSQTPSANLSHKARTYLASLGFGNIDLDIDTAALIWMHALAIGYAPSYLRENEDAIRCDWPRVPLPASADALRSSAALGRGVADILAYDPGDPAASPTPLKGIVAAPLRAEMRVVGALARVGGGNLRREDFALTAGWGHAGQNGVTMPGRGKTFERDYTPEERAAVGQGAAALGLTPDEAFQRLGATAYDVYLNDAAYWRCVPARVWEFYIGGYQVIKKWLSYRERELLGRDLTADELSEVTAMVRRLAALRLLEPALDANYTAVKADTYAWPADA